MSNHTQYLTLGLDQEVFGIDIRHVHEIIEFQPVAALPHARSFLLGMTDVRGSGTLIVDLRVKLGLPRVSATPATRIIILHVLMKGRTSVVGLVVDRVFEVTPLQGDWLDTPPDVGGRRHSDIIAGTGRMNGAIVVVFDLERRMADDVTTLADGCAVAAAA